MFDVVHVQLSGNGEHLPVRESQVSIPEIGCTRTTAVASWASAHLTVG
ncbi:hypothetical protein KZ309_26620 [Escherichia coli]|nr:hypothetical protein [Escherichia coli]MCG2947454.1 hypothetical protein [Escherichia coli]